MHGFRLLLIIHVQKKSDNLMGYFLNLILLVQWLEDKVWSILSCWSIESFYRFCCQYIYLDFTFVLDVIWLDRQKYGEDPGRLPVTHKY